MQYDDDMILEKSKKNDKVESCQLKLLQYFLGQHYSLGNFSDQIFPLLHR